MTPILFFFYLFIFLFGLIVGSFLNCIIYRLSAPQKFKEKRSFCPRCQHTLPWQDLIPLFSFLWLKGKCRYCKKPISWQYPTVEIATGLLFLLIFNFFTPLDNFVSNEASFSIFNQSPISNYQFLTLFYYLLIACFLIIIFVYDLKHYIIPDKIIYPAIVTVFIYRLFEILNFGHWNLFGIWNLEFVALRPFVSAISSAFLASAFFFSIFLISHGKWLGFGDVKLAFLIGLFLGLPNILVAFFFTFCFGAIIGLGLIIFKKKKLKSEVPFAPFFISGTFIAFFLGEKIISWYLNLLNF